MDQNRLILDVFGKKLIQEVFELNYRVLKSNLEFGVSKENLSNVSREILSNVLFDFLRLFEESEEFKIYYEKNNRKVNLTEISEMLKSEPIIENGWIDKYSKVIKSEI